MSNAFQYCLKGFKLKLMVVEPKMAQLVELDEESVEPDEEPVDLFNLIGRPVQLNRSTCLAQPVKGCKNLLSLSKCLFNQLRLDLNRSKDKILK